MVAAILRGRNVLQWSRELEVLIILLFANASNYSMQQDLYIQLRYMSLYLKNMQVLLE